MPCPCPARARARPARARATGTHGHTGTRARTLNGPDPIFFIPARECPALKAREPVPVPIFFFPKIQTQIQIFPPHPLIPTATQKYFY